MAAPLRRRQQCGRPGSSCERPAVHHHRRTAARRRPGGPAPGAGPMDAARARSGPGLPGDRRSLPHHGGPPQAGRHAGGGGGGPPDRRGTVGSGPSPVQRRLVGQRRPAHRLRDGIASAAAAGARGRRRAGAAHRLRQRRESATRSGHRATPRDRSPRRPGRGPPSDDAPVPDREPAALADGRCGRRADRAVAYRRPARRAPARPYRVWARSR